MQSMIARRFLCATGLLLLSMGPLAAPALAMVGASGAQSVVRQFCQADAFGQRVMGWAWGNVVAPLVTWDLEPAWDHVVLIGGFGVGAARRDESTGALAVDVRYSVIGQVSALGLDPTVYVETFTFLVGMPDQTGWRIIGPPPAPHIFSNGVNVDEMRRSLEGGLNFLPNTVFVWEMIRSAGWDVPFERTVDLLSGATYRRVDSPAAGDLVVYLRDGMPYHVGLLEAENQIVSSTLNAGIMRTGIDAFAGEITYLRLMEPEPPPPANLDIPLPSDDVAFVAPAPQARSVATPASKPKKPRVSRQRAKTYAKPRSVTRRAPRTKRTSKTGRRQPVATRQTR